MLRSCQKDSFVNFSNPLTIHKQVSNTRGQDIDDKGQFAYLCDIIENIMDSQDILIVIIVALMLFVWLPALVISVRWSLRRTKRPGDAGRQMTNADSQQMNNQKTA